MDLTRACASYYVHECVCVCVSVHGRVCVCVCVCLCVHACEHVCMDIKNMCVCVCMVYVSACVCVLPLDKFFICTVIGVQSCYTLHMIIQVRLAMTQT